MHLISAPLGMVFGLVTWAALRGRGGVSGLVLFAIFGSVAAFVGVLGVDATVGSPSDAAVGLGAAAGALLASVIEVVAFRSRPLVARSYRI
jgi:hypothetical protein